MIESHAQIQSHIINKLGLHARAAGKLVQTASEYNSDIHVSFQGQTVNAKSILGVMMLAAGKGSVITLTAEGDDAQAALQALQDLIADRFGEPE